MYAQTDGATLYFSLFTEISLIKHAVTADAAHTYDSPGGAVIHLITYICSTNHPNRVTAPWFDFLYRLKKTDVPASTDPRAGENF